MQPTAVEIVDRVIGGLVPGLPLVLTGASGSGRTVLALQLTAAALEAGDVVAYLCNEPCPFLLQQARSLDLDLDPAVETGQLLLLELDPSVGDLVRVHGIEALVDAVRAEEALCKTLVVDPFNALTGTIHDEASLRATARSFVRRASPMKIVLTVESEQLALQKGLDRVLSEVSGACLSLHRDERSGIRQMRVEKTRSGLCGEERVRFEIGSGGARFVETPADAAPEPAGAPVARIAVDAAPAAAAAPAPFEEKERPTVLLVDDDRLARTMLAKWLEAEYDVVTARDGFEAMTLFAGQRPDVVVLDLIMPRVTGYELLAALQRIAEDLPLLVVSSRLDRPSERIGPLVLGATDVLAKPVDRFELLHKVDMLLRLQGPSKRWLDPEDAEALFASISDRRSLDDDQFRARLDRAVRFGERYGMPSSLVGFSAPSSAALDRLEEAASQSLRFEDAVLRVSKRRAVVLLVATEPADAAGVVERLLAATEERGGGARRLQWAVHAANAAGEGGDWHALFRGDAGSREEEAP